MLRFGGDAGLGHFSKNALSNTSGFPIQKHKKIAAQVQAILTVAVIKLLY